MKHGIDGVKVARSAPPAAADEAMAGPIPEDEVLDNTTLTNVDVEDGGVRQRRSAMEGDQPLSYTSRQYDVGNKGFLSKSERMIRDYDTNNDGQVDINEIKRILGDLQDSNREVLLLKKMGLGALGFLVLALLGNFGLIWTSLALTRQLESQGGSLVDASTGKKLSTQARGDNLVIDLKLDYMDRVRHLLEIETEGRRLLSRGEVDFSHPALRRLMEESIGTLGGDEVWAADHFAMYVEGGSHHFSFEINGDTFTGQVDNGVVRSTSEDNCDEYLNIKQVNAETSDLYKVKCCGSSNPDGSGSGIPCSLYPQNVDSALRFLRYGRRRSLGDECEAPPVFYNCHGGDGNQRDCEGEHWIWESGQRVSVEDVCEYDSGKQKCIRKNCDGRSEENCGVYSGWSDLGVDVPCDWFDEFESCEPRVGCGGRPTGGIMCFSPLSTVIEKSKGKMFLKDLERGQLILSSNGNFRPFMYQGHSNTNKPTTFLQIHTDNKEDAPIEITPGHLIFLEEKTLPVPAEDVKVGDRLIGVNKPRVVTKIESVIRNGFYAPMTSDATLFVDGVLASSIPEFESVYFGATKVHFQPLVGNVFAPLVQFVCSKVNSYLCTHQVDDGEGGQFNLGAMVVIRVMEMSPLFQAVIFSFLAIMLLSVAAGYYIVHFLLFNIIALGTFVISTKNTKAHFGA